MRSRRMCWLPTKTTASIDQPRSAFRLCYTGIGFNGIKRFLFSFQLTHVLNSLAMQMQESFTNHGPVIMLFIVPIQERYLVLMVLILNTLSADKEAIISI